MHTTDDEVTTLLLAIILASSRTRLSKGSHGNAHLHLQDLEPAVSQCSNVVNCWSLFS